MPAARRESRVKAEASADAGLTPAPAPGADRLVSTPQPRVLAHEAGRRTPLGWRAGAGLGAAAALLVAALGLAVAGPSAAAGAHERAAALEARVQALEAEKRTLDADLRRLESNAEAFDGSRAFSRAVSLGIPEVISRDQPRMRLSTLRRLSVALVREAERNDLDPLLLTALARVESRFDPLAKSPAGARGLLQVMDATGRALMAERGETLARADELFDLETSVALGAAYFASLQRRFDSTEAALLAYNRGPAGAKALRGADRERALAGYPKTVLGERDKLARAVAARADADARSARADASPPPAAEAPQASPRRHPASGML